MPVDLKIKIASIKLNIYPSFKNINRIETK